jgi:hypothetical protein
MRVMSVPAPMLRILRADDTAQIVDGRDHLAAAV